MNFFLNTAIKFNKIKYKMFNKHESKRRKLKLNLK